MKTPIKSSLLLVMLWAVLALPLSAATPTARPEEVGLSSERLRRITELMERHIGAGSFSDSWSPAGSSTPETLPVAW